MQVQQKLFTKLYLPLIKKSSTIKITNSVPFLAQTSLLPYYHLLYIVQFSRCNLWLCSQIWRSNFPVRSSNPSANSCLVGPSGLEPPTLRLSVVRSSQLSYGPLWTWWRITGSNRWPPECKSGALPAELIPQVRSGLRTVRGVCPLN